MEKEKKVIKRENWISSFNLVGAVKVNDYTFKLDEQSEKSSWIYNSMNLAVDCGEKHGLIYTNMIGGYSADGNNVIYCHAKNDDGSDDFGTQMQVAWEDRTNPEVLEDVGEMSFYTVGIERTTKGQTYYEKFLSPYDVIQYIAEHLEDGTVVSISGTLKYGLYNGNTTVQKNITRIVLSNAEPKDFKATFTQSILVDADSVNPKEDIDKDKGIMYVKARVLDYLKDYNGIEVKGQYPFAKTFEFPISLITDQEKFKKLINVFFKPKKNTITQITFIGEFIEMGGKTTVTLDDIPDDIKELIDLGVYTEEQALEACSTGGNREQRMVITQPYIKNIKNEDGTTTHARQIFYERYTEDDLVLDYLVKAEEAKEEAKEDGFVDASGDDYDWLADL